MRKVFIMLLMAVVVTMGIMAEDFRGLDWGASRGEVLLEEGTDYYDQVQAFGKTRMWYSRQVLPGVDSTITFTLYNDALREGVMAFPFAEKNRVVTALTDKYGETVDLSHVPDMGFDPARMTGWQTESTYILGIDYSDKGYFMVGYFDRVMYDEPDTTNDSEAF